MIEYKRQTEVPDEDGFYFAELLPGEVCRHPIEVVEIIDGEVMRPGIDYNGEAKNIVAYYLPAIELPALPQRKPEPGLYAVRVSDASGRYWNSLRIAACGRVEDQFGHQFNYGNVDWSTAVRLPEGPR